MPKAMTHNDQMRLALEAKVSLSSIRAYLRGNPMRPPTLEMIRQCADRLRLAADRPEKPKRTRAA